MTENIFKRVEYFKVVKTKLTGLYNYLICSMCGHQSIFCHRSLSAFLGKKLGKPTEEIKNLNGFEYMYLSDLKVPYF
jgi:hypothetical protein